MSSQTMWSYLQRLPLHITTNHFLAMLGFREFVFMQTAQVRLQTFWQDALIRYGQRLKLCDEEKRCHLALKWMFQNGFCVEGLRIDNAKGDWNNFLSDYRHLLRSVHLSVSHNENTDTALSEDVPFLQKIYSLHLGLNMDLTLAEAVALHSTGLKELSIAHPSNIPIADLIWARNPGLSSLSILCALEADLLHRIQRCGASLRKLEVMLDVDQCAAVATACPHLTSLSLTISSKRIVQSSLDAMLMAFAERCPSLTRVTLLGFSVTSTAVRMLALRCPRLQSFQASGRVDLIVFAEQNTPLERVVFADSGQKFCAHSAWLAQRSSAVLEPSCLRSPHTDNVLACMTQLRCVELQGPSDLSAVYMAHALEAIAKHCPHLTDLTISNLNLDESDMGHNLGVITRRCNALQRVRIECKSNSQWKDYYQMLAALTRLAPQLLQLELGGFFLRDNDIVPVINLAVNLVGLKLTGPGTEQITDALMFALAECCPHLQTLSVIQSGSSPLITEEAVLHTIHHCRRLRAISVSGHSLSSEAQAELRAQYEAGRRLHRIDCYAPLPPKSNRR